HLRWGRARARPPHRRLPGTSPRRARLPRQDRLRGGYGRVRPCPAARLIRACLLDLVGARRSPGGGPASRAEGRIPVLYAAFRPAPPVVVWTRRSPTKIQQTRPSCRGPAAATSGSNEGSSGARAT